MVRGGAYPLYAVGSSTPRLKMVDGKKYRTCAYCIHEGYNYNGYVCDVRPGVHKGTEAIQCPYYEVKD